MKEKAQLIEGPSKYGYSLHQFTHNVYFLGKEFKLGKSRDLVNWDMANQGFTVATSLI